MTEDGRYDLDDLAEEISTWLMENAGTTVAGWKCMELGSRLAMHLDNEGWIEERDPEDDDSDGSDGWASALTGFTVEPPSGGPFASFCYVDQCHDGSPVVYEIRDGVTWMVFNVEGSVTHRGKSHTVKVGDRLRAIQAVTGETDLLIESPPKPKLSHLDHVAAAMAGYWKPKMLAGVIPKELTGDERARLIQRGADARIAGASPIYMVDRPEEWLAKGEELDRLAELYIEGGLMRDPGESDASFRHRVLDALDGKIDASRGGRETEKIEPKPAPVTRRDVDYTPIADWRPIVTKPLTAGPCYVCGRAHAAHPAHDCTTFRSGHE